MTCCSPRRRRPVPDRVRRDLIDRDYEIIRPVRPHRHAAQAAAARLAHRYVPDLGQAQLPAGQHLEPGVGGEPDGLPAVLNGLPAVLIRTTGSGRLSAPAGDGGEGVPVRGVQVRRGLLEHHGRYFTGPGPLRGGRGRGQPRPLDPAPPTPLPSPSAERPAHWHLVRSRARRCRSGGPGSRRRCVPARPVRAAGGVPGCGSGCGGRSSP